METLMQLPQDTMTQPNACRTDAMMYAYTELSAAVPDLERLPHEALKLAIARLGWTVSCVAKTPLPDRANAITEGSVSAEVYRLALDAETNGIVEKFTQWGYVDDDGETDRYLGPDPRTDHGIDVVGSRMFVNGVRASSTHRHNRPRWTLGMAIAQVGR